MSNARRKGIADRTLAIIEACGYKLAPDNYHPWISVTSISHDTHTYFEDTNLPAAATTVFEVTEQTTLQAARELTEDVGLRVGVLNFASAKNPGGGFLRGTQAQEESLARSSTLYASLSHPKCDDFYFSHRESGDLIYSDRMIFTENCVVFRDDDGTLLAEPYEVHVLTAAAPNLHAIKEKADKKAISQSEWGRELTRARDAIDRRIEKMLSIFELHRCTTLILGAWGCGVFGNYPDEVSASFYRVLSPYGGKFANRFHRVRFAIYGSEENLRHFRERFAG